MPHFKFFATLLLVTSLGSLICATEPPARNPAVSAPSAFTLALGGFDAVTYYTAKKPVLGSVNHSWKWAGHIWLFSTKANRSTFMKDPVAYAPQYDGDCACLLVTEGKRAPGDPKIFRLQDGKLYLFSNKEKREMWDKDPPKFIREGDKKGLTLYHVKF